MIADTTRKTIQIYKGMEPHPIPADVESRLMSAREEDGREAVAPVYFTAIVTPGWLRRDGRALPIETVNGIAAPARTVGGTIALICTSPATAPGDVPA